MNDNWWTMQRMIEEREREIRLGVAQARPWLRGRTKAAGRERGGMRRVIGRALLAWGSALLEE